MVYAGEAKEGGKVQVESSIGNLQCYWPHQHHEELSLGGHGIR